MSQRGTLFQSGRCLVESVFVDKELTVGEVTLANELDQRSRGLVEPVVSIEEGEQELRARKTRCVSRRGANAETETGSASVSIVRSTQSSLSTGSGN